MRRLIVEEGICNLFSCTEYDSQSTKLHDVIEESVKCIPNAPRVYCYSIRTSFYDAYMCQLHCFTHCNGGTLDHNLVSYFDLPKLVLKLKIIIVIDIVIDNYGKTLQLIYISYHVR